MSTTESKQKRQRRSFTKEFKEGAVKLVLKEGKSIAQVAPDLDLTPSALGNWVEHALAEHFGINLITMGG